MKDLNQKIKGSIKAIILKNYQISDIDFVVEIPKDKTHGDLATNVAMVLTKFLKRNPLEIAEEISNKLKGSDMSEIDSVEFVRPGFINIKVKESVLENIIDKIINEKASYGKSTIGLGKQVMIEFGQPNTHKAFHVGHLKSAISGLSMVKLHENLGYDVIKVNFYGDIGMQVAKTTWGFINSEVPKDFDNWNVHDQMKFIDKCYVFGAKQFKDDKDIEQVIRNINKDIYAEKDNEDVNIYTKLRVISLKHQKDVWETLGIVYDREYPESEVYKEALNIIQKYKNGLFQESEGAIIFKGEDVGLTNWVFLTGEGNPTYSAKDLALGYKKFEEYPNLYKSIVTTSIEIKDYFKVIIYVLGLINPIIKGRYFHIPFGWMLRGGKKFSSRMGESVKGIDIIQEVREVAYKKISEIKDYEQTEKDLIVKSVADAGLKFLILSHEFHKDFSYDPEQFLSLEGFSGPYIQYTYSRAKSILDKSDSKYSFSKFSSEDEKSVTRILGQYPEIAEKAGIDITPHSICNYLYELAQEFNSFYTKNSVLKAESEEIKNSRLALTAATAQVLKNGLNLLGIKTVDRM